MTSVNATTPRARTGLRTTTASIPVTRDAPRSHPTLDVVPLWAAPHAAVLPAAPGR
ncbi:hypothetical protein ACFXAF_02760 [Kitasatospora sp. NPDC059463]|uniref:hypothetical protein n=1 Tax=unclassified Kitasatospora TaxID=2633591 RepID=UPI00367F2277